jgi:Cof subfamily protein (haloacid dehalogenase superfamily)
MIDLRLQVDSRDVQALQRAQEAGIAVIACTGRPYPGALPWIRRLGLRDPFVCYQGAQVRTVDGEVLFERDIEHAVAMEVIRFCRGRGIHVHGYRDDRLLVERERPEALAYAAHSGMDIHLVPDLDRALGSSTPKLVIVASADEVEHLLPEVRARWEHRLFVTTSLPTYLELTDVRADKRRALDFIARKLGIAAEDAVAVGDGRNDAPMLEWAGLGVAVQGAPEELVRLAERIIPPPGSGGIAELVDELWRP